MSESIYMLLLAVICILLQLPPLFFGFELCDAGFYATFYDAFSDAPESVSYNYMYYLSGAIGNIFHSIFPNLTGLRVAGLLVNTLSALCVASLFRRGGDRWAMLLAALLIIAGTWESPLTLSYDQLTTLFTCACLLMLVKGTLSENPHHARILTLFAGITAGLNTFVRIPNVLGILYILIIPCALALSKRRQDPRLYLAYTGGWLAGIAAVILLMSATGDLSIFMQNLRDLREIASQSGDEASHGLGRLISAQIEAYAGIFRIQLRFIGLLFLWQVTANRVKNRATRIALTILWAVAAIDMLLTTRFLTAAAALLLMGCAGSILRAHRQMAIAATAGLAMALIFPLGSDGAIYNNGSSVLWIAAVPAITFYTRYFAAHMNTGKLIARLTTGVAVTLLAVSMMWNTARAGFYFDDTPVNRATARIETPRAGAVHTSPERAEVYNRTINLISAECPPGEKIMIYGSGPMLHYLTGTLPATGCSWPEQYSAAALDKALQRSRPAAIVVLRYPTLGNHLEAPSEEFTRGEGKYSNVWHNGNKYRVLERYLKREGYRAEVSDSLLTIYRPGARPAHSESH